MKVIVTSHNPVKIGAVREAFLSRFPMDEIQLVPVNVKSDVPDQPMSDQVTRQGARNRVNNAKTKYPDADYWVGMEGLMTRESVYTQTLILTLIPFVHELWL